MENGFSPCDEVRHVEYTLFDENGKPWTPRNANKKLIGDMVTVKWGAGKLGQLDYGLSHE